MEQFKTSLKPDDLKLFYDVLYQYENEGKDNHKGYSYKKVPLEIKNKVFLKHQILCVTRGRRFVRCCLSICAIVLLMLVLSVKVTIMS